MTTLVMGVLNVTPDSFYDGGRFLDPDKAIARGLELIDQGAAIIDVGGESTRPGAKAVVSADEELSRVIDVVAGLSPYATVSIDTRKAEVARAAVAAGAVIINDVSASLAHVAAETGAGWIAMHMNGAPGSEESEPHYDNVVREVADFLIQRAQSARQAGVQNIWIDPGIGFGSFGKTMEQNLQLLAALDVFTSSEWPVVVGTSRKTFLGHLAAQDGRIAPVEDRLEGSLATAVWAATHGVSVVRVHDVRETVRALRVIDALREVDRA